MTTYTEEQITRIGGSKWIHPSTGETRLYINDWPALAGLSVSRYNSGNIASATLDGEHISNARARDILGTVTKVWWSGTDQRIHITAYTNGRYADYVPGWIREGIAVAVEASEPKPECNDDDTPSATSGQPTTTPAPAATPTDPSVLIAAMRAAGRSVRDIAAAVGVHASTVYRWARGLFRPIAARAARLAALAVAA